ncbi:5'-3' exonuclease, C-terminal domain [Pseudocohnilembus persalinus]|uniref:Flap endonuclease 1 n=1 Tax=Pseudocohnilembus persalinus TaxID=266149 RepID=A0A0V0R324_PSEPJ|nr:5'-3' exonuclease, C-terminal domain [Pseudocohnilembus persalinus]|eukprot:KRX08903.1 5'-3' exonuclease, C-terminal domain [Pseudocohnilembus persalinus]
MGIKKLMDILREKAPGCIRKKELKFFGGRSVACDASMAMYQFLVTTQGSNDSVLTQLTDKDGNKTGHLVGLFNRTLMFLENGIKPAWVFDGKPPTFKSGELAKRKKAKEEAKEKVEQALEAGNMEEALKQQQRTTYISKEMKEDAMKMLKLLGCPVIVAPCEAEAQCAFLAKSKKVYATVTEDMDALTFQTPVLIRGLNSKKEPVYEISYDTMMEELGFTYEEFIDFCILCGCDYTCTIEGIGPTTAFKLIKEHKTIEKVIEHLEAANLHDTKKKKTQIPENFNYKDSRPLFFKPDVIDPNEIQLKWEKPNEVELKKFLVEEKGFSEQRVENGLKKIKGKEQKGFQSSLENFFGKPTVVKKAPSPKGKGKSGKKGVVGKKK